MNFSSDVPKMHYFSNKFSKISQRWRQRAPSATLPSILVAYFSDVILITTPKNVTKIASQIFFHFRPPPIKISGYASVCCTVISMCCVVSFFYLIGAFYCC